MNTVDYDEAVADLVKRAPPESMGEWQNVGMVAVPAKVLTVFARQHKPRVRTYQ